MAALDIPNSAWQEPSDREIDQQMKDLIKAEWSEPPTAVQIGKAMGISAYFALVSGFVMRTWTLMYEEAMVIDGRPRQVIREEVEREVNDYIKVPR